jgi:hypothetical protein
MNPPVNDGEARFVGLNPWLPWPLSAWRWWTAPVRAERLAVLRIGLALALLVDLWLNYRPYVADFFAVGSMGGPEIHAWYADTPKLWWSIFRGFHDPILSFLALSAVLIFTGYLGLDLWARLQARTVDNRGRLAPILIWLAAGVIVVLGVWARDLTAYQNLHKEGPDNWRPTPLTWAAPLALFFLGWVFWVLESLRLYLRVEEQGRPWSWRQGAWWALTTAWAIFFLLFVCGIVQRSLWMQAEDEGVELWHPQLWQDFLLSWQKHPALLQTAFWIWAAAVLALLVGWQTRAAAIAAWILSSSFANLNPNIDNAGDTVRGIILFYLMLCPCGAAYSIDSWLTRRRGWTGPAYVSPWPLRLLFIQMVFIYWCNGMYKITSKDWLGGDSLYLVFSDLTLTRFSHAQLPLPYWMTRIMTWTVLSWELSFPILVCNRWTRPPALALGFMFHLGIFISMELGGFAPYMWALYLPFLPWERWIGPKNPTPSD